MVCRFADAESRFHTHPPTESLVEKKYWGEQIICPSILYVITSILHINTLLIKFKIGFLVGREFMV